MDMDNDELISLMYENRCLWDMIDKNYHNRDISRQKGEKVATELNTSNESAKSKWRGLSSTFPKELAKNPKKRSGDEGGIIETTFDEDTHNNSNTAFSPEPLEFEPESVTEICESPQEITNEMSPQNFAAPQKKKSKLNNATAVKKLIMLEEQKIKMFQERNSASRIEDPDYHFLMSLLPYLRKVPEERKMFVRTKLQQVFCEEDFSGLRGQHLTLHPNNHPTYSSTNDKSASESEVEAPRSTPTPHHEDLAQ